MFLKILNVGRLGVKEEKGVFFLDAILKLFARREGISTQHKQSGTLPIYTQYQLLFFFFQAEVGFRHFLLTANFVQSGLNSTQMKIKNAKSRFILAYGCWNQAGTVLEVTRLGQHLDGTGKLAYCRLGI